MAMLAAGLGGAAIGAVGSAVGSGKQADATKKAAQLESQTADKSLAFNRGVYNDTFGNEAIYRDAGTNAAYRLQLGLNNGDLTKGFNPTSAGLAKTFSYSPNDMRNDPAYAFTRDEGIQAEQRSAAAQGGLVSGGAMKDIAGYTTGLANQFYNQDYERALATYQQNYSNAFNTYNSNQANDFNHLMSVAGLGQNAVTQTATSGANAASNAGITAGNAANAMSNLYTAQGNAGAAATIGVGNSIQNGLNNWANNLAMRNISSGSSYGSAAGGIRDSSGNYIGE